MASMTKKRKPVDLRILQAEASLMKLCRDKHQFEKYIPSCDEETKIHRFVRHRKVRNSVLIEEEKLKQLEKNDVTRKTKRNTEPQKKTIDS